MQNGKLVLNADFYGERNWVVHSSNGYGYEVSGDVVTMIINNEQEFVSAFLSGLFACKVMIALVTKAKLSWFALYCLLAAAAIFIFG